MTVAAGRAKPGALAELEKHRIWLRELGRIERTLFILDWLQSVELRSRVHVRKLYF